MMAAAQLPDPALPAATPASASAAAPAAADEIAAALAVFSHGLRLEAVPAAVRERASHLVLDAIGCGLAARHEDFAQRYGAAFADLAGDAVGSGAGLGAGLRMDSRTVAAPGGRGVLGHRQRLPLRDAVMFNGVLAHGLDFDDTHMAGVVHLTVSVLPAALGVAAQRGASGADLLAAVIVGLEAGARIASVVRGGLHTQGFHPTGVVGAFAAALAAGRLMGLGPAQLVAAQGFALSLTSGNLQFLEDGAWTKRLHPGWAAQAGITAATMAAHGIPAPTAPYTGRYGLYRSHLDSRLLDAIDLSLGTAGLAAEGAIGSVGADGDPAAVWELTQIAIKPFPMCHFVHAAADAAIALHRAGIHTAAITDIEVLMPAGTMPVVCEPITAKRRPASDYDAKFSLPYAVASGLLRGRLGLQELQPAAYTDPAALALMDRMRCTVDPDATFPRHYSGELRVTLADGTVLRHREAVNRGHAERPLGNAEVREKFDANAALHFSPAQAGAIGAAVQGLASLPDVRTLEDLLAQDPA